MKHGAVALSPQSEMSVVTGTLTADPPAAGRADAALGELAARVVIVALFTVMAVRIGMDFMQTGRVTGLLLLASEALVVILTVFRRASDTVDRSIRARVLTTLSMLGPPIVRPAVDPALLPEAITVALSVVGLLIVIAGKLSLGRSFGLMPANRGVVSSGLYRLVRHPIYLGYLFTHVAFLAAHPTGWNLSVLLASDIALLARAVREEETLAKDAAYRDYRAVVRWRVVPGLF